jgi:hypothetical protein
MSAVVLAALKGIAVMVGGTLWKMFMQLVTEDFIKYLVVQALEKRVTKTPGHGDDDMLDTAKKYWGME